MNGYDLSVKVSVSHTISEWLRLIDLIDIASYDVKNEKLATKLREVSSSVLGEVAPLGIFKETINGK